MLSIWASPLEKPTCNHSNFTSNLNLITGRKIWHPNLSRFLSFLLASASTESSIGGWQAISNLTDLMKVVEIPEFAVKQHNMQLNAMLRLVSVVKGETQMVNGINYKLVISATDALATLAASNYRVVVWDKPWIKERNLTSFEKIS